MATLMRVFLMIAGLGILVGCGGGSSSPPPPTGSPAVSLSVSTLTFASQAPGTSSAAQAVTVTDSGTATLSFTSIALTAGASDFTLSPANTCGTGIGAGAACTISVTFTPPVGVSGTLNGTLTITDNASNSPQTVTLTGTATAPTASVSPSTLPSFGNQAVGTTGASQPVTLNNTGTIPLTINSIVTSGNFSETTNCPSSPSTLAASGSCTINVSFAPTTTGPLNGTLTVTDNASTSPQTVSLSGTGIAPGVSLSSTSVSFSNQPVSTTSAPSTVTVTNNGTASLTISSVTIGGTNPGDFAKSADACTGATVTPTNACTVSVTFTPTATGSRSGTLTLADNASTSPQTVSLGGTGTTPGVGLSPTSVPFGNQLVGTTSTASTVTVTNNGTASLTISAVTIGGTNPGDFAKSADACTGATVTPTNTCTVSVTFTPTATGSRSGTLTLADNASGSPQTVGLSGTGTAPLVSLSSPTALSFGNQTTNITSAPLTETVTNTGAANLTISTVAIGGTNASDFAKSADTCTGATVTPNNTCMVSVTFTPAVTGALSGTLTFTDNNNNVTGSTQTLSLSGAGVAPSPAVTLSPTPLTFASGLGVPSAAQPVTLTNTGTANLTISTVTVGGTNASDFATSADTCTGATVTPNNTCTVRVTFTSPANTGTYSGTLTFTDNASNSPQTVSLTGTGLANTAQVGVNLGPTGNYTNGIFITVTVCQPGTTTCVQVPNVLVDTGSFGLRLLSQVQINGSNVPLPSLSPAIDPSGGPYYECVQYGDLSYTWGEMEMATVQVGGETATQVPGATANSGVPIQVIPVGVTAPQVVYYSNGTNLVAIPNQCLVYPGATSIGSEAYTGGTANNSVAALGANGIMGIGNFANDCGTYCAVANQQAGTPSVIGYPYMFYDTTNNLNEYILDLIPVTEQAWNPVAAFPTDNNGEMLSLPAIPAAGQSTATGTLTFGVGTESNNAIPGTATVYQLDNYGYFGSSTFNGVNYTSASSGGSFLDSGSNFLNISDVNILNAYLNPMSLSVSDCGGSLAGWYCPSSTVTIPLLVAGTNSASTTVNLPVGNATSLLSANFAAYNDVAVESCSPASSCNASTDTWDLGLPFFYGRPIIIGFEGTMVGGVTSTYGYYAF